ncbi:MAG TPA: phosphatase PAP2 family protein [Rhodopirellula baltica]|uniref:Membrane-associated phospholipid phosphatase n=2 Tax=Rhodopirellula baltica TaxID=265606 RepID=Q7UIY3_RHOBA|nr:phosphatase PAP2 family protein [Rhodopirellula baltica]EKK00768.1 phosphoesterase PA-phosphatase related protein [Rhodopirellula baltica SH28]CAD77479.1 membrane-associated phospholipid phosphatase [Rhodopirellula baltica SH 1]HBE64577.1 phosphatase PAP2 family protein [Rhodopirellula baltica]
MKTARTKAYTTLSRWLRWLRGREPILLVVVLLVVGGIWTFAQIAGEVIEGETKAFDEWAVRAMRQPDNPAQPIGPPFLQEMGRDATALGGIGALSLFTIVIAGYLWLDRKRHMTVFLIASTLGGLVISLSLKHLFDRPRPDMVPHLSIVHTSSFPSGHSMLSAVVYLTLGSLLASVLPRQTLRIYTLAVACVLTLIVGVSRVYLGVHYPTDVLAGWIAGLTWALSCWLLARRFQRSGQIETEQDAPDN